jgi:hypothetical protein
MLPVIVSGGAFVHVLSSEERYCQLTIIVTVWFPGVASIGICIVILAVLLSPLLR